MNISKNNKMDYNWSDYDSVSTYSDESVSNIFILKFMVCFSNRMTFSQTTIHEHNVVILFQLLLIYVFIAMARLIFLSYCRRFSLKL